VISRHRTERRPDRTARIAGTGRPWRGVGGPLHPAAGLG
jgi:hypothetical protein